MPGGLDDLLSRIEHLELELQRRNEDLATLATQNRSLQSQITALKDVERNLLAQRDQVASLLASNERLAEENAALRRGLSKAEHDHRMKGFHVALAADTAMPHGHPTSAGSVVHLPTAGTQVILASGNPISSIGFDSAVAGCGKPEERQVCELIQMTRDAVFLDARRSAHEADADDDLMHRFLALQRKSKHD
jgi:uncharacterized protein (UPF0335 family)